MHFQSLALFFFSCWLASTALMSTAQADDRLRIVTDIAPVHSLVSMVVGDDAAIDLLVPPSQSPHGFSLKPSQVRAISNAQLVIMLSDDFTPGLSRHTDALNNDVVVVQLSDTAQAHENRNVEREYSEHQDAEHDDHAHDKHTDDQHTWLNVENAIAWIDVIEKAAIMADAQSQTRYQENSAKAKADLTALHQRIQTQLANLADKKYLVYHDAYQHFATGYALATPIAIALSDARAPSAAKIKAIQKQVSAASCIFSEQQHDDAIVDMIASGQSIKRGMLDPMGSRFDTGPAHYSNTMLELANSFSQCLSD